MDQPLHRLVYYSRNQIGGDDSALEAQIADILAASRRNNERDNVTGTLLFNAGCFAQVLEGPLSQVEATFERIQQDDRHGDVSLLAFERIEARSFPDWAMGYVGQSSGNSEPFADIGAASGFDPARLNGEDIHILLRDLAIAEERA